MRILLNDKEVIIPSSLSEFTLGQRVVFYNQYGKELDEMQASIMKMEEGLEKELEIGHLAIEKMFRTFAFFANTTVEALQESEFIDEIFSIYHSSVACLFEEEQNIDLKTEYVFKGELWELHPPELKHGSKMKFGEFIDSKQLIKDMIEVGNGKWDYMIPLCAIYFRKKGEPYSKEFLYEGSERLELMKELPMDIALAVGFFLFGCQSLFLKALQSSLHPGLSQQGNSVQSTSKDMVGSIS